MSSIVACASGASAAPNVPWMMRKATICSSVWAMPHSTEVAVKPIIEKTNRFLRPKRLASQPTGAVMIAETMM